MEPVVQAPMYDREELLNMIHSALDLLTLPYREAFILRYYQGMSYKSMAEITGDSIASLKVRVMRAKDQVRHILAPYIHDISKS
jgi:RNA polymerase sigma-70 factor (ECF subfamily)